MDPHKQYEIDNKIYYLEDEAHQAFQTYLRKVGEMERLRKGAGCHQLNRDLKGQDFASQFSRNFLETILTKAVDTAKLNEHGFPIPRVSGTHLDEYESGYACAWALYHIDDLPSDFDLEDEKGDLAYNLTGWYRYDGGVGRRSSSDPYYRKVGKRILVKQFRGLDI